MEQLAYDCRLLNVASARSKEDALRMRDLLVESDAGLDPQAWVLRPDVVLRIAAEIEKQPTPYLQTRVAAHCAGEELAAAFASGNVQLDPREVRWLDKLRKQIEDLPEHEEELIEEMLNGTYASKFIPEEYGIPVMARK
jgi:methanol--5-hydroxybenzimidazolylcobamide Co-methyltransferase